ncbi:MAG: hypothetical protein AAB436_03215 [Patescibacteria group bacterium]
MSGETASQWVNTVPRPDGLEGFQWIHPPKPARYEFGPDDTEVALNSMAVRLPDEPLWINGSPYELLIHHDRLARPVNKSVRQGFFEGKYQPRSLTIQLDEGTEQPPSDPLYYDTQTTDITVAIPKETTKSQIADEDLAEQLEAKINRGIRVGLEQNRGIQMYFSRRKMYTKAGRFACVAVGEAVGVAGIAATEASASRIIEGAVAGIAAGYVAYGALLASKVTYNKVRFGSDRDSLVHKGIKNANKRADRHRNGTRLPDDEEHDSDRKWFSYFDKPIIELRRVSVKDEFVQNARQRQELEEQPEQA